MDLKEFVSTTLMQIIEGVTDAQAKVADQCINPGLSSLQQIKDLGQVATGNFRGVQTVRFDVALSTSEGTETKGKAGIFIAPITLGTQGQSTASNSSVSRVEFGVP